MPKKYRLFDEHIKKAVELFRKIDKEKTLRVVSHHDADGICAAALMLNALNKEGFKHSLSIIKQLTEEFVIELSKEDFKFYIFTDLGAGQYEFIKKYLPEKTVYILDHHSFDISVLESIPKNIIMVNPFSFGIDSSIEISGAGVVYLFTEALNEKNKEFSYLAIIGALGDVQEKKGFIGLNIRILETAIKQGKIKKEKGLKWFGLETKSLVYLMTYSMDVFVPGITGSESNAIQFLKEIGIEPKLNNKWVRFNDLKPEEKKRLISSIVMKRTKEKNPEDILGNRYILLQEPESSQLRDLKEFSTLLNACGRMDKASLGIGVCLNNDVSKRKAIEILAQYKKEIVFAIRWYEEQKESGHVIKGENYVIINAHDKIMPTIIGTLASIVSNFNEIKKGTLILSMARDTNNITKASLRIAGEDYDFDLREILNKITQKISGQSGGHRNAAGAIIPSKDEKVFIEEAIKVFRNMK